MLVRSYPGGRVRALAERVTRVGARATADGDHELVAELVAQAGIRGPWRLRPWNVLVCRGGEGWRCSGWLDWEFAMGGDADYDLMRNARSRLREVGPVPEAFYRAYGRRPDPVRDAVYEAGYYLHMANDARHFTHRATYDAAERYLRSLRHRVDLLDRLLG